MTLKYAIRVMLLLMACWTAPWGMALQEVHVDKLSRLDLTYMDQQRALLQDLATTHLGRRFSGDPGRDLDLLQTLLDRRLVRPEQSRELQAMGIVFGDLLAAEYKLHWVVYEDNVGRSRALRYMDSDFFLFPVTMISRRREVGDLTPVNEIYDKASTIARANTPTLPFQ